MPRFKLTIEYDGTGLAGWQRQPEMPSVQQHLEEAIERYCGQFCFVQGAGRTDAGVHALGQVAHVDLPEARDVYSVQQGLNYHLHTPQIIVKHAERVSDAFHARFDAVKRRYEYRIINRSAPPALWLNRTWHVPEKLDLHTHCWESMISQAFAIASAKQNRHSKHWMRFHFGKRASRLSQPSKRAPFCITRCAS
jgi:tRNA pseudouridine38-40 synthase